MSRDRDGRGKSPDEQHAENVEAVRRHGWIVHPDPYRDDDISASRYSKKLRAGFDRLIADLESGSFDAGLLVLWESSRGSRRVDEWVRLIGLCEQHAVVIFVTTHGREYDPTTARDRKSLLEDAVDSEYESAKTSARIRRSVKAAAEQGRPHGKNLYGYRRVYDETTRRLLRIEPHPEQAPVVQEAARRFLAGETFYAIAKNFNERGIPPRRPSHTERRRHYGWTPPAVKEMIGKPAYAGKRQFRGEVVSDALWPPLIDPEVWETKLLPQLNSESRRRTNDWPARHLLAGIAVCGVCGAGARVGKQNQGRPQFATDGTALPRKHYNTYVCSGVPGRTGFHVAMKKDHLDEVVTEFLLQRLQRPDFLATTGRADHGVDAERLALLAEIEEHRSYLAKVREQAAARKRMDILFDQEDRIQPLIDAAKKRLETLAATDPLVVELAASDDVRSSWEALPLAGQRRVIRALMTPRIMPVSEGKRGRRGVDHERVDPGFR
ncbi:recombinase family protein [Granulicoccus phenolivorans]|uniref:recombinase family protein n=1 Tax=Granulicoccus phenolivorans TaxID=266854 RepID=UPI000413B618|nr:recombinase family protein [Granulicoccus phenolivorans]